MTVMPLLRAAHLKAPVDAAESGQSFANRLDGNLQLQSDGDGRGRVAHVVRAGNRQTKTAQVAARDAPDEIRWPCGRWRSA